MPFGYERFTYEAINVPGELWSEDGRFSSQCPMGTDVSSIAFECVMSAASLSTAGTAWKLQIAIDDHDPVNIARGWEIVKDILIQHEIALSKVVRSQFIPLSALEKGKQITIYSGFNPLKLWEEIIYQITYTLAENHVVPGQPSSHCRQIPGSNYVWYRNDFDPVAKGHYLSGEIAQRFPPAQRYNPSGYQDPYLEFRVVLPEGDLGLWFKKYGSIYHRLIF